MLAYVLGCLLIIAALWILGIAVGWGLPYLYLAQGLEWLSVNPWESIALATFLFFLGLLFFVLPRNGKERAFRTSSKEGEVRISQEALQEIIARSAAALPGVQQVESNLRERESGLRIRISCQFDQGVIIPQTSEELQKQVKNDVELYTGIIVSEVKVLVRGLEKARPVRVR